MTELSAITGARMRIVVLGFIALVGTSGCATTPIPVRDAQIVPPDRIYRTGEASAEGNARALFVRDVGFTGGGIYKHLFINGVKAASLDPGEKVEFVLPPGEYVFGVVPTDVFGTHTLNTIDQDLKAGRRYYYRVQTDGNSFRTVLHRFIPEED